MTLLRRFVFLKNLQEELSERIKEPSISPSQKEEICKHLRKIDTEIRKHSIDRNQ
ncbi:hypothetical protein ABE078_18275 [Priestia megaterium]